MADDVDDALLLWGVLDVKEAAGGMGEPGGGGLVDKLCGFAVMAEGSTRMCSEDGGEESDAPLGDCFARDCAEEVGANRIPTEVSEC